MAIAKIFCLISDYLHNNFLLENFSSDLIKMNDNVFLIGENFQHVVIGVPWTRKLDHGPFFFISKSPTSHPVEPHFVFFCWTSSSMIYLLTEFYLILVRSPLVLISLSGHFSSNKLCLLPTTQKFYQRTLNHGLLHPWPYFKRIATHLGSSFPNREKKKKLFFFVAKVLCETWIWPN